MTHPTREEWMSFLYGELNATTRRQFENHLSHCTECKQTVATWRGTMDELDAFKVTLKRRPQPAPTFSPAFLKWGIAALFILGVGFGIGRLAKPAQADARKLQAAMIPVIREQLRQEFKADLEAALARTDNSVTNEFRRELRAAFSEWAATQSATGNAQMQQLVSAFAESIHSARLEDRQATLALWQQNLAAYALLKNKLETVAVVADNRFQETETQLGHLISYAQPKE